MCTYSKLKKPFQIFKELVLNHPCKIITYIFFPKRNNSYSNYGKESNTLILIWKPVPNRKWSKVAGYALKDACMLINCQINLHVLPKKKKIKYPLNNEFIK